MYKKLVILFLFVSLAVALTACSGNNSASQDTNTQNGNQNRNFNNGMMAGWEDNFAEASSTDLVVGQKVMVMGTESNGVITADRIVIGDADTDWQKLMTPARNGNASGTPEMVPPSDGDDNDGAMQTDQNGNSTNNTDNRQRFENMTDEERQAMREQMMANGGPQGFDGGQGGGTRVGSGGTGSGGTRMMMSRVTGEIISVDATSVTVKTDDGGSKIIFLAGMTRVMKAVSNNQ